MKKPELVEKYEQITSNVDRVNAMTPDDMRDHFGTDFKSLLWQLSNMPGANLPCYDDYFKSKIIASYKEKYKKATLKRLLNANDSFYYIHGINVLDNFAFWEEFRS